MEALTFQQRYGYPLVVAGMLATAAWVAVLLAGCAALVAAGGFMGWAGAGILGAAIGGAGILGAAIGGAVGVVAAFAWWLLNELALRVLVAVVLAAVAVVKAVIS